MQRTARSMLAILFTTISSIATAAELSRLWTARGLPNFGRVECRPNGQIVLLAARYSILDPESYETTGGSLLPGHVNRGMALSDDGSRIADLQTYYRNNHAILRIWDVDSGVQTQQFSWSAPFLDGACPIAFSADGMHLAAGEGGGSQRVFVWSLVNGLLESSLAMANPAEARSLALSPDGAFAAAIDSNGHISLWRTQDQLLIRTIAGRSSSNIVISRDGAFLLGVNDQGVATRWSLQDGSVIDQFGQNAIFVFVSRDSQVLGIGESLAGVQRRLRIVRPSVGQESMIPISRESGDSFTFSPDGSRIYSTSAIFTWNVADGSLRHRRSGHASPISAVAALPTHGVAVSIDPYTARYWDLVTGASRGLVDLAESLGPLQIAPTGGQIATYPSSRSSVQLRDPLTLQVQSTIALPSPLTDMDYSADGSILAVASQDGHCRLFYVDDGSVFADIVLPQVADEGMRLTPDATRVLVNFGGSTACFSTGNGVMLWSRESEVDTMGVCVSPDGNEFIYLREHPEHYRFSVDSGAVFGPLRMGNSWLANYCGANAVLASHTIYADGQYRSEHAFLRGFDGRIVRRYFLGESTTNWSRVGNEGVLISSGNNVYLARNPLAVAGDLDGDGDVSVNDLAMLLSTFGVCEGETGYDALADADGSGCTGLEDLAAFLGQFGG